MEYLTLLINGSTLSILQIEFTICSVYVHRYLNKWITNKAALNEKDQWPFQK